jgi:predicted nucleic acid-binding protein
MHFPLRSTVCRVSTEVLETREAHRQSIPQLQPMDDSDAWHYREILRFLKKRGELIGANDPWIAAATLRHKEPLVSRNARDFQRGRTCAEDFPRMLLRPP